MADTPQTAQQSALDFSDLGGQKVAPAQTSGGLDFSDLGGERVSTPTVQPEHSPERIKPVKAGRFGMSIRLRVRIRLAGRMLNCPAAKSIRFIRKMWTKH